MVEKTFVRQQDISKERGVKCANGQKRMDASNNSGAFPRGTITTETTGWAPTCSCDCDSVIPATVLDCFAGSGTTLEVALSLGHAIGIELNQDYIKHIEKRLKRVQLPLSLV